MSTRRDYPHGVPCWVAVLDPDVEIARRFYAATLGWEFQDVAEGDAPFYVATLDGAPVASVAGPEQTGTWITAVAVDDLNAAVNAARATGGTAPGESIDIPTLGRFHRLADPAGTEIHIVQLVDGGGAARVNEPGAWAMSALATSDVASVAPFYAAVFGWRAEDAEGTTLFRLPGYVGGEPDQPVPRDVVAIATSADASTPAVWTPEFWVHDVDAVVRTAVHEGGRVVEPAEETDTGFRTAYSPTQVEPCSASASCSTAPPTDPSRTDGIRWSAGRPHRDRACCLRRHRTVPDRRGGSAAPDCSRS